MPAGQVEHNSKIKLLEMLWKGVMTASITQNISFWFINPFLVILYPLKTPENLCVSVVFRRLKLEHRPEMG